MQTKGKSRFTYSQWFGGILIASIVASSILSIILLVHGPRVRFVRFDQGASERSYTNGSTVVVHFDRPLEDKDYSSLVSFTPELKNKVSVSGQTLRITSMEHFKQDTEYELRISSGIADSRGTLMSGDYSHRFKTPPARFAFIERNYASLDSDAFSEEAMDYIKIGVVGEDSHKTIFSNPEIRLLAANRTHAVVVVREAEEDVIYTVSLDGSDQRREELLFGGRITALALSPLGSTALMSVVPDFSKVSREYYDEFAHRVVSLNVETGEIKSLSTSGGAYVYATSIKMDGLGQVALIQDLKAQFFAISPYNDYDPILVGTYVSSEGIRPDASEILFQNDFDWERYNVATSERTPFEFLLDGAIDQVRFGDGILVSVLNFERGGTRADVYRYKEWQDVPEKVWSENENNSVSLYTFSAGYDESLLAIQFNFDQCQFDRFETNSQCVDTTTSIVDTGTDEFLDEFNGFDVVWLP